MILSFLGIIESIDLYSNRIREKDLLDVFYIVIIVIRIYMYKDEKIGEYFCNNCRFGFGKVFNIVDRIVFIRVFLRLIFEERK